MTNSAELFEPNDANLVAQSLTGNRDAFGHIVAKYQSLIASLAYSGTGNLSQSEDLAQEFFTRHYWLDITQGAPRNLFWTVCFAPMFVQWLL